MKLTVLGCSGGIGAGLRTTCLLLDEDVLIDAGTGVGELTLEQMIKIKDIFITHSHLDHVAGIPLLVDTVFNYLNGPLVVHAHPDTLNALQKHIFNWTIWPDFTELPSKSNPSLVFSPMQHGERLILKGRQVEMIPVSHAIPAVGYCVSQGDKSMAFSGDTSSNDTLWSALNAVKQLDLLIVECAFGSADEELARLAGHYCPKYLGQDIKKLKHRPKVGITHLKPGDEAKIFAECEAAIPDFKLLKLNSGDIFSL